MIIASLSAYALVMYKYPIMISDSINYPSVYLYLSLTDRYLDVGEWACVSQ